MEKRKFLTPPGLELRPLSRPARSQSLYRLRYPILYRFSGKENKFMPLYESNFRNQSLY
jgi:hypothetical protein